MESQEGRAGRRGREVCAQGKPKPSAPSRAAEILSVSSYQSNSPGERLLFIPLVKLRLVPWFVQVPIWRLPFVKERRDLL